MVMSFLLGPSKGRTTFPRILPSSFLYRKSGRNNVTSAVAATDKVEAGHIKSILIANRGEIALSVHTASEEKLQLTFSRRVGRTASQYGIKTTTVYTKPDARSQHALSSPFAINLGDTSAYLDGDRIIEAAIKHGCSSVHPGYGFVGSPVPIACF